MEQNNLVKNNETPNESNTLVSITEAAHINKVTRQAIYVAIKQNKLKALKATTRWSIKLEDLEEYRKHKYSRTRSMFNGELIFDHKKGFYSVAQTAELLNVPAQKIYYATRVGHIKTTRKGAAYVIHIDEIRRYREEYLKQTTQAS